jgi:hypothetical protein
MSKRNARAELVTQAIDVMSRNLYIGDIGDEFTKDIYFDSREFHFFGWQRGSRLRKRFIARVYFLPTIGRHF